MHTTSTPGNAKSPSFHSGQSQTEEDSLQLPEKTLTGSCDADQGCVRVCVCASGEDAVNSQPQGWAETQNMCRNSKCCTAFSVLEACAGAQAAAWLEEGEITFISS